MRLAPLSPAVGAEVWDIRLQALADDDRETLRKSLGTHGVLVVRDQNITPEEHRQVAQIWGDIVINPFLPPLEGFPDIGELCKEPDQTLNIGATWHTDTSYEARPALGSLLVAREIPPSGGDTLFAGMAAAYAALSDGVKETIGRLRAIHSSVESFSADFEKDQDASETRYINAEKANHTVSHPMVITHPISGQKCLFVNPDFTTHIEGWTREESQPLLSMLYAHATRPEFTYRLRWEEGTVAIWDNRATLHCALNDYSGHRRVMHRITVAGQELG